MPIEFAQLLNEPEPLHACPKCGFQPFYSMMRGMVQSGWRKFFRLPYCTIICGNCDECVGFEKPPGRTE